ncbi:RsmB/NOP family class I SAM-dependent RNA methyltransferase [Cohaesibacter gelatinilyticus]|uniref:16S rRNA (Cytosine967-C5)-methyltransferase n=1 Tax=Cohaesibacter gelatinilyticus TaxID=372072 RepID=A0A285PDH5_9HYPH|nr:transcription antitermination factor NusB [Cohaesibacter gelatinilyticus]SNZ19762.1 16S rRNA (cytosine967-C5)-methyltransferase [Cohaesibacter gelatinilyticus]
MTDPISFSSRKAGMAAREGALRLTHAVLNDKKMLDEAYQAELENGPLRKLPGNDRAFAKRIVITLLQHLGEIDQILASFMDRGIPKKSGPLRNILRLGVAELLFLQVPSHAVVDSAVTHFRTWKKYAGFKGLTNAVLRQVSQKGAERLKEIDTAKANLPDWLYQDWLKSYGKDEVDQMVEVSNAPSTPLDLSFKANDENAQKLAEVLEGQWLETGSLRLASHGKVDELEGFESGEWWVQDTAASLPVKLLGDVKDTEVLDLCAAPGGKTMQLAALGADVTALDLSGKRLQRIQKNLDRTKLEAKLVQGDALKHKFGKLFPAILLDAPCSATGTMRRHPELIHQRSPADIAHFAKLQARMLRRAADLLDDNGVLVFCTCSLQAAEGPDLIPDFLMEYPDFGIDPVEEKNHPEFAPFIQSDGSLRTRPDQMAELGGLDGFYIIRFRKYA